ncbi:FAD-dependent oxidoreductase [Candidatus Nomurabacteria bacterium]|nr:FAD-dependent oxidoreductase [Candidatus Nomurabacteria bacterium]MCB9827052.1 FAD-dependent oxidoreductase [Candidatus Nomurabacteria bacterium]MCB9827917.1 FAD-dependent oxidoreductase [Candidatus Nomurabacteria bacterium]
MGTDIATRIKSASNTAVINKVRYLTATVLEITLSPAPVFIPGQFINVLIPNNEVPKALVPGNLVGKLGIENILVSKAGLQNGFSGPDFTRNPKFRSYSICTTNYSSNTFRLIISVGHIGLGSLYFKSLKQGDSISYIGPTGKFSFHTSAISVDVSLADAQKNRPRSASVSASYPSPVLDSASSESSVGDRAVFIVTGTGISPIISMLAYSKEHDISGDFKLYWGLRSEKDIFYLSELEYFSRELGLTYKICLSKPLGSPAGRILGESNFADGRVTENILGLFNCDKYLNYTYYVCGNPSAVLDVIELLRKKGICASNIYSEGFTQASS